MRLAVAAVPLVHSGALVLFGIVINDAITGSQQAQLSGREIHGYLSASRRQTLLTSVIMAARAMRWYTSAAVLTPANTS